MFLPYNTDAPLYHRPIGTLLLIFANILAFIKTKSGWDAEGWVLTFGNGLQPSEWISASFVHFGVGHLIGNLIFLWVFGLLVEGKIGTLRFLALYLLICLTHGFFIQLLMLGRLPADGPASAGGASGAIFGLMAIALLWAPQNHFDVLWVRQSFTSGAGGGTMELSVVTLAGIHLIWNFAACALKGFSMGSEFLHLQGAATGAFAGVLFLKKGWVDCEGWDAFTLWKKHQQLKKNQQQRIEDRKISERSERVQVSQLRVRPEEVRARLMRSLQHKQFGFAYQSWLSLKQAGGEDWQAIEADSIKDLVRGLVHEQRWREAAQVLEDDYLQRSPSDGDAPRLKLAEIHVRQLHRPRAALRQLSLVDLSKLNPEHRQHAKRLHAEALASIEDGTMELG